MSDFNAFDYIEKEMIIPQISINPYCKVLDIGCGCGRWAESLCQVVTAYLGIDIDNKVLEAARKNVPPIRGKIEFELLSALDLESVSKLNIKPPFNRFILSGIVNRLNQKEVYKCFKDIQAVSSKNSIIYIRVSETIDFSPIEYICTNGFVLKAEGNLPEKNHYFILQR